MTGVVASLNALAVDALGPDAAVAAFPDTARLVAERRRTAAAAAAGGMGAGGAA